MSQRTDRQRRRLSRARTLWPILALAALLLCVGCERDALPNLLNVVAFAPADVDVGDRLEVIGTNLPEGRPATVTFHGDLHRPGREPIRDVQIVARAMGTSQSRIVTTLSEALQAEFCGIGEGADHTTFRGDVVAAFAPKKSGAPPVTGRIEDVVLDVEAPPPHARLAAEREKEGRRLLDFLGMKLDGSKAGARLVVSEVVAGGRAERAGLAAGDLLVEADGVSARGPSDLVPASGRRFSRLRVRRGRLVELLERPVEVAGFRAAPPSELALAALLIGVATAIVLLFMAPFARVITWAERRVALRLRGDGRQPTTFVRALGQRLAAALAFDTLPPNALARSVPYSLLLAASVAFTLLAFGRSLVMVELDAGILVFASTTALVTSSLVFGGFRPTGRWSFVSGVKRAFSVASLQLPLLLALIGVVLLTGSLRPDEMVVLQGAAPWRWHVLASPMLLVAFLFALVTAVPESSRASVEPFDLESAREQPAKSFGFARSITFFAEWAQLLTIGGVLSIAFLGGWRLPFVSPSEQASSAGLQALGAVLLQVKCAVIVLFVLCSRSTLAHVSVEQVLAPCWRWLVPLSVLALVLGVAWLYVLRNPALESVAAGTSRVLFALAVFVVVYFALRVLSSLRSTSAQLNVNPWL